MAKWLLGTAAGTGAVLLQFIVFNCHRGDTASLCEKQLLARFDGSITVESWAYLYSACSK